MKANEIKRQLRRTERNCKKMEMDTLDIINRYLYDDARETAVCYALRRTARKHRALVKLQARLKANR